MKIYLTGQNNFGNRGCEALTRSTVQVVRHHFPSAEIVVPSLDLPRDRAQWPDAAQHGVSFVPVPPVASRFIQWSRIATRLPWVAKLPWPRLAASDAMRRQLDGCNAVLSIGGDNYSLDYDLGSLAYFVAVAEAALERRIPVLLWGASVGPFSALPAVEQKMAAHLKRLDAVTVRESHSHTYLKGLGLGANLHMVADSAFIMQPQPVDTSAWMPKSAEGVVGVNLSPLVAKVREKAGVSSDLVVEAERWIRELLSTTPLDVLLVPHVAPLDGRANNNDEVFLARLQKSLADAGARVQSVPSGLNAAQLKHVISQCRYFIGARTHATIAAMSTGVPTLSIAYSVKARGINLDLFGHERYVLDTRKVDARSLAAGLKVLRDEEEAIKALYAERLPLWRQRARAGGPLLAGLLSSGAGAAARTA